MKTNRARLEFIKSLPQEYLEPRIQIAGKGKITGHHFIVTGAIIGRDGFGYEYDDVEDKMIKVPHRGDVIIGKDVEIGGNCCIDRATLEGEATLIGDGTKIDNLVHIAHNVKIGRNCLIVAGAVIGGSVTIGDRCFIGMGALIKNKVTIGNDVTVGMGAVVLKDVPDGWTVIGNPAKRLDK